MVYPNPAKDFVTFDLKDEVFIYTITGELVQNLDLQSQSTYLVPELGLETGIYIVKSGTLSQKLIIK